MNELYKQIHIYLNMDKEISFDEFDDYYKKILEYFNEHADNFDEDALWKGLFISENVMTNADARAKEAKKSDAKKYKKISQRLSLWAQNFSARLGEMGYTNDQLNERFEEMFEEEVE
ncbi:hypothetical protein [Evansella tamaricis]|uniref:Uncharacterized protein n=1 Tax=Evansella tamaricis TaxID=2069301 RepID=A0ABS6JM20_9BACI|nr:hypothetical protein [Evansella tamaricis]MBU9714703.1 hypothetical protein [Evansella tamaricis]